jgi:hypothetical protein
MAAEYHSPTEQTRPVSPGDIGVDSFIGWFIKIASSKIPIGERLRIPREKSLITPILIQVIAGMRLSIKIDPDFNSGSQLQLPSRPVQQILRRLPVLAAELTFWPG